MKNGTEMVSLPILKIIIKIEPKKKKEKGAKMCAQIILF